MAAFSSGKHALMISDRSGVAFPYREMVQEWTGMWVHTSEFEPKQPQLEPRPIVGDPQGLPHIRPSRKAFAKGIFDTLEAYNKLGKNVYIIEQPPLQITSAKTVYYRSLNSDLSEFKNNLSKNSVKMDKHIHFQMYVKKIFQLMFLDQVKLGMQN